jgi:hypothetical protein
MENVISYGGYWKQQIIFNAGCITDGGKTSSCSSEFTVILYGSGGRKIICAAVLYFIRVSL